MFEKEIIKEIVAQVLNLDVATIKDSDRLSGDLRMDYVDYIKFIMEVEKRFGASINEEFFLEGRSNCKIEDLPFHLENSICDFETKADISHPQSLKHRQLVMVERNNEEKLNKYFNKKIGHSFEDTDKNNESIYSDVHKYSCGGEPLFFEKFGVRLNREEVLMIRDLGKMIEHLQQELEKIRKSEYAEYHVKDNNFVDGLLSRMFGNDDVRLLMDSIHRGTMINEEFSKEANEIIKCLLRKIVCLRLKYCSYL